jgi:hypothetical protein
MEIVRPFYEIKINPRYSATLCLPPIMALKLDGSKSKLYSFLFTISPKQCRLILLPHKKEIPDNTSLACIGISKQFGVWVTSQF